MAYGESWKKMVGWNTYQNEVSKMLQRLRQTMKEEHSWDKDLLKNLATFTLGISLIFAVGCGGDDASSAAEEEYEPPNIYDVADSDVPEIEVVAPEAPPAEAATAQAQPQNMAASVEEDETEEDIQLAYDSGLDAANDALESFYESEGRFPKSMKELLDQGELTMYPRVPPGKKLVFSREERKFRFVTK